MKIEKLDDIDNINLGIPKDEEELSTIFKKINQAANLLNSLILSDEFKNLYKSVSFDMSLASFAGVKTEEDYIIDFEPFKSSKFNTINKVMALSRVLKSESEFYLKLLTKMKGYTSTLYDLEKVKVSV